MSSPTSISYEDLSYRSQAYPASHPDRLATVATLFGLQPAELATARVLEIGCGAGGNLLPVAAALPGATCVGVDLSPEQIRVAREAANYAALPNIEFWEGDFARYPGGEEPFDYIIAHGVYSWVSPAAQQALLALCARLLAPQGIAYLSYNVRPGWDVRGGLREMLLLHEKQRLSPGATLPAARGWLRGLAGLLQERTDPHALQLRAELEELQRLEDFYLAHEYLEPENSACWFHEFDAAAQGHGLQFLAEAEVQSMSPVELSPQQRGQLRELAGDIVQAEQMLDFLRNRAFRQTLLCRAEAPLQRAIAWQRLERMHLTSFLAPMPGEGGKFADPQGNVVQAGDPFAAAAFAELAEASPASILFPELLERVSVRTGIPAAPELRQSLALGFLATFANTRALELSIAAARFVLAPGDRPLASGYARWQAAQGGLVANLRHENIQLGAAERSLLQALDGSATRAELATRFPELPTLLLRLAAAALLLR